MRRTAALTAALLVVTVACGGDDDTAEPADAATTSVDATDPPAADPPATDPPATDPPATDPPGTDPPGTDPPTTDPPGTDAPADGTVVQASLIEWEIVAPTEFPAGSVTFEVSNDGEFPHEFVVVRGESYDALPKLGNGAVDEDALAPDDIIGQIDRFEPGQTMTATFDLAPGDYVLLCNIAVGPNSHAAAGQVLSVTVTG